MFTVYLSDWTFELNVRKLKSVLFGGSSRSQRQSKHEVKQKVKTVHSK